MHLTSRQHRILERLRRDHSVQVDNLAVEFDVTTQTIRRDLLDLCNLGLATRIHGGARESRALINQDYEKRRLTSRQQKDAIATLAAPIIPNNCTVMMNIGTTTEQVAHHLLGHRDLTIISNNINIINILINTSCKELVLAGGTVRPADGAIIGADAVSFMNRYKADFAIVGASAIDPDGAILDHDLREVAVARAILENARVKILVADSTKFTKSATVRICGIDKLDYFVTDKMPSPQFLQHLKTTTVLTPEASYDPT